MLAMNVVQTTVAGASLMKTARDYSLQLGLFSHANATITQQLDPSSEQRNT